jgi:hypothetical protein
MLRRARTPAFVALTVFVAVSCSPATENSDSPSPKTGFTACEEPRPQVCTAHYDPVCGALGDGTYKTYSNACSACSDAAVTGHRPGACE